MHIQKCQYRISNVKFNFSLNQFLQKKQELEEALRANENISLWAQMNNLFFSTQENLDYQYVFCKNHLFST